MVNQFRICRFNWQIRDLIIHHMVANGAQTGYSLGQDLNTQTYGFMNIY
jgi:hypothetical protein